MGCFSRNITMGRAITGMYFKTCSFTSASVVTWVKYPRKYYGIDYYMVLIWWQRTLSVVFYKLYIKFISCCDRIFYSSTTIKVHIIKFCSLYLYISMYVVVMIQLRCFRNNCLCKNTPLNTNNCYLSLKKYLWHVSIFVNI